MARIKLNCPCTDNIIGFRISPMFGPTASIRVDVICSFVKDSVQTYSIRFAECSASISYVLIFRCHPYERSNSTQRRHLHYRTLAQLRQMPTHAARLRSFPAISGAWEIEYSCRLCSDLWPFLSLRLSASWFSKWAPATFDIIQIKCFRVLDQPAEVKYLLSLLDLSS